MSYGMIRDDYIEGLQGQLVADNAYTGRARARRLRDQGLVLLARPSKKQVPQLHAMLASLWRKRWRIETVIGQLKRNFGLALVSSCRCPATARTTVFSALALYGLAWSAI